MPVLPVIKNFIDGQWQETAEQFQPRNPATQEPIARVANSDEADIDAAVRAARSAFHVWKRLNATRRAEYLHKIGDAVASQEQKLARAITVEMGKTIGESTGEVQKLAKAFHYYAEEATRVNGELIPNDTDGFTSMIVHEPIGVIGAITPWNYPLELIGWKLCAALAAGCTIVVKPSEYSPVSAAALFECIDAAGLPAGVANLVLGSRGPGPMLVAHPGIDKIAFTGSTATGTAIAKSIPTAKPLSMELGGSCPMIVTDKADVHMAVKGAARRGFRNAGQICIAVNRIYVHENVYAEFLDGLTSAVAAMKTGDGMDPATDVGPMTTPDGVDKVEAHVKDAVGRGAVVTTGGSRLAALAPGNFYEPTVVADCTPDMLIMHEETFGPVVGVMPYSDLETAIGHANGTEAGLAAYVYTQDLTQSFELGHQLDFGNVAVNNVDAGIMNAPYGGRKGSGYGYEHGKEGLHGYLQLKHLRIQHGA